MERNREKTKERILQAAGRILARTGFTSIGINAVAREADVDKVLIYRYFGGMPGLLVTFAQETDYWPKVEDMMSGLDEVESLTQAELAKYMFLNFSRYIHEHILTQEMLRWEVIEKNELTSILDDFREQESQKVMNIFKDIKGFDMNALVSILAAGVTYLVLRKRNTKYYNGIDLSSDAGWSRIEQTAAWVIDIAFQNTE